MRSVVSWFNSNEGCGYVTGNDDVDRRFEVPDAVEAMLPNNGDMAEFEHRDGEAEPRAAAVTIVRSAPAADPGSNDRRQCVECGMWMIPNHVGGELGYQVCPLCSAVNGLHYGTHCSFCHLRTG